jgi:transposase
MEEVTLVGVDLGKHSFHLHAQDRKGKEAFRRKVTRRQLVELFANFPTCTIAMEACDDTGAPIGPRYLRCEC